MVRAAVEGTHGDHVLALLGGGHEDRGDGGHAAGEGHGLLGAFQLGQGALEAGHGGVVQAGVDARALGVAAEGHGLQGGAAGLQVADGVGAGEVEGGRMHAQGLEVLTAGVDGERLETGVLEHGNLLRKTRVVSD